MKASIAALVCIISTINAMENNVMKTETEGFTGYTIKNTIEWKKRDFTKKDKDVIGKYLISISESDENFESGWNKQELKDIHLRYLLFLNKSLKN